ncbi:MAG: hypothetical protein BWY70_00931 [Bacteroidetes bacterium ADurb.Bin408]|nr:MAG: hypothetical protein BWY70_00931 [Bacteroidetes bacterium ADurb.Bin408]
MMKPIFVAGNLIFNLFFLNLIAQDSLTIKENNHFFIVKTNLNSLVDYTPALQFSFQYHIFDRLHLQHEAGFITHYLSPFWYSDSKLIGYRIKNQVKYYIYPYTSDLNFVYVALEAMFKKISYEDERYFGRYDNAYFESIRFEKRKNLLAFSLMLGFEPVLENKNWLLDIYGGLGFRHLVITEVLPPDLTESRWSMFRRSQGNYNLPGLYFGIRVGYKFSQLNF